jgi:hypothetical protein
MSNKITLAQVHTMLTSVVDEVIALKDRLSVVQQHIGGVDATINSTLGRMDAIESTVANVVAAIADMKPTEPFTQPVIEAQVIQPAHVLAQPVIENGKLADLLCELSTEDLRKMSGLILAELKRRSKTASASFSPTPNWPTTRSDVRFSLLSFCERWRCFRPRPKSRTCQLPAASRVYCTTLDAAWTSASATVADARATITKYGTSPRTILAKTMRRPACGRAGTGPPNAARLSRRWQANGRSQDLCPRHMRRAGETREASGARSACEGRSALGQMFVASLWQ